MKTGHLTHRKGSLFYQFGKEVIPVHTDMKKWTRGLLLRFVLQIYMEGKDAKRTVGWSIRLPEQKIKAVH